MQARSITHSAFVAAFFTLISRIFGLVRDIIVFHIFGASKVTDAFLVAFTIPNLLRRLVGEGGLTVCFVPVYTETLKRKGKKEAALFFRQTLSLLLLGVGLLVAFGMVFAEGFVFLLASGFWDDPEKFSLTVRLTRLMFPYLFVVSLVALCMGALNAHRYFGAPAASPIFLNIGMIFSALFLGFLFEEPIFGLALGVLLGGVMQLLLQLPFLKRVGLTFRPAPLKLSPEIRQLFKLLVPTVFGLAVYQVNIIVLRQIASFMEDGQLTYYYNADRLFQFAFGVFVVSIATAVLPAMSEDSIDGKKDGLLEKLRFSLSLTNTITIPAALGLFVLAFPIVAVIYRHGAYGLEDVQITALVTMAFAPSLIAQGMNRMIIQGFYATKDMKTPVWIGLWSVLSNLVFGLCLMRYGIVGLAGAISISSFIQLILLAWLFDKKHGTFISRQFVTGVGKQVLASVLSIMPVFYLSGFVEFSGGPSAKTLLSLCGLVLLSVLLYGLLGKILKLEGMLEIVRLGIRTQKKKV